MGTIPWFLASTFADFFIGWLGFLTAVASAWGYRKLHGRKSLRFATVTVILCSMLTLFGAEIASWMYVLCTDPEWQADAAYFGVSVARLAWESILMPENWGVILPSLGVGMLIGLLGVLSVRPSVKQYVTGQGAAAIPAQPGWGSAVQAEIPAAEGPLPTAVTVRDKKWVRVLLRVIGIVDLVFFAGLELLMVIGTLAEPESSDGGTLAAVTVVFLLCAALGVFLVCNARRKLVVEGSTLSYLPTFGAARTFSFSDVAGMKISANGRRLLGRDGKVLARFEDNQEGSRELLQILRSRGIGLTL